MVIRHIERSPTFEKNLKSIRDQVTKERIKKAIRKIIDNPEVGKPLQYGRRGERRVRIGPYRLIYAVIGDTLFLLDFMHREGGY